MYITYLNPPKTRQITFDEILAGVQNVEALHYGGSNTSTMTVCRNDLTAKLRAITNVPEMIEKLAAYNVKYAALESSDIPSDRAAGTAEELYDRRLSHECFRIYSQSQLYRCGP